TRGRSTARRGAGRAPGRRAHRDRAGHGAGAARAPRAPHRRPGAGGRRTVERRGRREDPRRPAPRARLARAGLPPDTSCLVAAVCAWHEHHAAAAREIERRLAAGEPMIVAAPALVESYAVLTRLPPPHRLRPADAL